jgi:GGDEF domain-containing protein
MDDIDKLKQAFEDLQEQLRKESTRSAELERRCLLLEKLAYRDPSTGLRTENYLHARLREEIERSIRYPSATSLITVCAPRDEDGRLPELGVRLADELRSTDQVFGMGEHGLAILLVETPEEGARRVLERLGADLDQFISGYGFSVTSFPVDANLADEFITLAMERHSRVMHRLGNNGSGNAAVTN